MSELYLRCAVSQRYIYDNNRITAGQTQSCAEAARCTCCTKLCIAQKRLLLRSCLMANTDVLVRVDVLKEYGNKNVFFFFFFFFLCNKYMLAFNKGAILYASLQSIFCIVDAHVVYLSQRTTKPTIRLVRPSKTQIRLRECAVWSESLLIACAFNSLRTIQRGINDNPCNTRRMYVLVAQVLLYVLRCPGSTSSYRT